MLGNKFSSSLFAILFILLFAGCAVEGPPTQQSSAAATSRTLRSILVTPANPSVAANTMRQFTAIGTFTDNDTDDITNLVTWRSSDTNIATVDRRGLAVAQATAGSTTISASYAGRTGSAMLTVTTATIDTITVTPANPSIPNQVAQQFTAIGTFSDTTSQDITTSATWASADQNVATMSNTPGSKGYSFTVGVGSAVVTAAFGGRVGSTTLTVVPPTLTSISVTPANPSVFVGSTRQFTATGYYDNNTSQNLTATVTWSSSDLGVATIDAHGLASALLAGTTTVQATSGAVVGTTRLEVATSGTTTLTWDAPTQFADRSPLIPSADLQSYNLYYRTAAQTYTQEQVIPVANPGTLVVVQPVTLATGTYFFVVTAVTQDNFESAYSNEVEKIIH